MGITEALKRIEACRVAQSEELDLGGLQLTSLDNILEPLCELDWLKRLYLGPSIKDRVSPQLAVIHGEKNKRLCNALGALPGALFDTLSRLEHLDLALNQLTGLPVSMSKLTALTSLDLGYNDIGPEGAQVLKGLTALTSLDLTENGLGPEGARALKGLNVLNSLNLAYNNIGPEGARALKDLTALTSLNLAGNSLGPEGVLALKDLTALTKLNLADNSLGPEGVLALKGLTELTTLDLEYNSLGEEGTQALKGLTKLTSLHLSCNDEINLAPLKHLTALKRLTLNSCRVSQAPPALWYASELVRVQAQHCVLPGDVPPALLSQNHYDNCLPRLRAYYRSLDAVGPVTSRDVKLMLLGNGRVGKTKLRRRLEDDVWDPITDSTHGIHIGVATSPAAPCGVPPDTPLKIWDFGGQDIYLGTHALFLRSRAVFPVLWTPDSEPGVNPTHTWNNIEHENFPLGYWVRYVAHMAGTASPLLLIHSQCEDETQRTWKSPIDDRLWQPFTFKRPYIPYSAKTDFGRELLTEGLRAAIIELDRQRPGDRLPASWAKVKAHIEVLRASDQRLEATDRKFRTICLTTFADICRRVGGIEDEGSVDALLYVLHDYGTVFWRDGWFKDLIIVDQQWALGAVYSVLDRDSGVFRYLRDERRGRFTQLELDALLWGKAGHTEAEQRVFIEMMLACGICFVLRRERGDGADRAPAVYLAPDLLPPRADRPGVLADRWEPALETQQAAYRFPFLPPGLLRGLMSGVGEVAGDTGEYWRDGFFLFDGETGARLLVEETRNTDWSGSFVVSAQKGDARELLARISAMLLEQTHLLGVSVDEVEPTLPDGLTPEELNERRQRSHDGYRLRETRGGRGLPQSLPVQLSAPSTVDSAAEAPTKIPPVMAAIEPGTGDECYISYKHGDNTPEGEKRQETFEGLLARLQKLGLTPVWDANELRNNDSIDDFEKRIARGDKVVIVLSDGYLTSRFCVAEMVSLHAHCLENRDEWRHRVRIVRVSGTRLSPEDWGRHALHWQDEADKLESQIKALEKSTEALALRQEKEKYIDFARKLTPILKIISDTLHIHDVGRLDELNFEQRRSASPTS